jgi:hypothetical protein
MLENETKARDNFWDVIHKHGTSNDRRLLFAVSLFYGLSSIYIIGYPLWFKEPEIICHNRVNGLSSSCSEVEACLNGDYTIVKSSSMSFTSEKELICEKAEIKRKAISFSLFGYIIGMFLNMILPITAHNRKDWIGVCCLIFSAGALITLILSDSMIAISYGLCTLI